MTRTEDFGQWGRHTRGWRTQTRQQYERAARRWVAWCDTTGVAPARAGTADVVAFLATLPPTAQSRNQARKVLRAWFAWHIERGSRATNPTDGVPTLRLPRSMPRALPRETAARVMAEVDTNPRLSLLVALMLYGGLRNAEARNVQWADICGGLLTVSGKGGNERVVPLHSETLARLRTWRPLCDDPVWLFPGRGIGPLSASWLSRRLNEVGEVVGVHLTAHSLRHTLATLLLEDGTDVAVLRDLLGHASIATTNTYLSARPALVVTAVSGFHLDGTVYQYD